MSIVSENAEKKFLTHTEIGMNVEAIVHGNALFDPHQHSRVSLDTLIVELIQYRDSLPTIEEYIRSGRIKWTLKIYKKNI